MDTNTKGTHGGTRTPGPGKKLGPPNKMKGRVKMTLYLESGDYEALQAEYGRGCQEVIRELIRSHLAQLEQIRT